MINEGEGSHWNAMKCAPLMLPVALKLCLCLMSPAPISRPKGQFWLDQFSAVELCNPHYYYLQEPNLAAAKKSGCNKIAANRSTQGQHQCWPVFPWDIPFQPSPPTEADHRPHASAKCCSMSTMKVANFEITVPGSTMIDFVSTIYKKNQVLPAKNLVLIDSCSCFLFD